MEGTRNSPSIRAFGYSDRIELSIYFGSFDAVAIDTRRHGGDWELLGITMDEFVIDRREVLIPGRPETREYRVQGIENYVRVGEMLMGTAATRLP